MSITRNITQFYESLPLGVTLIAVSKFHPVDALREAYDAGQRVFGESRVQELTAKQKELPQDIEWHFIGTLQTNKVKDIAPFIHMIHSVDSLKLLQEINKQAIKNNQIIRVLLEVHIAREESKHGFSPQECLDFCKSREWEKLENIRICGLMSMATYTENEKVIRDEFSTLSHLFTKLKKTIFLHTPCFKELSMGMSHDYQIAIEEGSTMVRIGTSIFGERE
ncbi:MAG: YggS family pyridoxal phosphate-dependent enzyme [Tannerellaceae bacterium]|nr:YggS family pyridoxal phosphate-dependent enzyme [Tannerellaceae bacterium]